MNTQATTADTVRPGETVRYTGGNQARLGGLYAVLRVNGSSITAVAYYDLAVVYLAHGEYEVLLHLGLDTAADFAADLVALQTADEVAYAREARIPPASEALELAVDSVAADSLSVVGGRLDEDELAHLRRTVDGARLWLDRYAGAYRRYHDAQAALAIEHTYNALAEYHDAQAGLDLVAEPLTDEARYVENVEDAARLVKIAQAYAEAREVRRQAQVEALARMIDKADEATDGLPSASPSDWVRFGVEVLGSDAIVDELGAGDVADGAWEYAQDGVETPELARYIVDRLVAQ